ncbi:CTD phosphatase Fcp1 [Amphichorda felina]
MYDKVFHLGTRLHYPITVTKLLKSPGDTIKKQENIIEYKFSWRRRISDDEWVDETTYTEYDSPAEGTLKEWRIREGMVISADVPCMTVEEACGHEVQISGLCSLCGADMTEINWASEERDMDRANINMTHDQIGLMVSESVATRAEHESQKRLLKNRKLSLVVDLDQTIIHACIDPTVGEWQSDPNNPNHDAVKDVKSFQLSDDGPRGITSGCTYYIKLRPGLREFLEEVSNMYELHVYTMGTRAYAQNIARIVDPDRKLFGNRVISRDENGSITAKTLQRLFPVSTNMVVIIDDRADVWPMNRPNLIKVSPYDFFKGIGDINSSFLPKRTDILPAAPKTNGTTPPDTSEAESKKAAPEASSEAASKASPLDELVRMSSGDDEASLRVQAEEQEKTLEKQLHDRPLQHMQEELDKEEETQESETGGSSPGHHRNLLSDDDEELITLQDHLTDLHSAFYETYDRRRRERRKGDPRHRPGNGALRRTSVEEAVDLSLVPDVGDILDDIKSSVLEGLVIVLSGLVPLGVNVEESDIGMQAQSFGAQVLDIISKRVTHLVVASSRPRTKKVQQAAKIPSIRIVNQNWLQDCLSQWRRLDESPYYISVASADRERGGDTTEEPSEDDDDAAIKGLDNMDWEEADDHEIQELLGMDSDDDLDSEDDDESKSSTSGSGSESEGSESDKSSVKQGTKRKASTDDAEEEPEGESVLAKKQRVARNRGASGLRSAFTTNGDDEGDEGSSLPTPGPTTGDESQQPEEGGELDEEDELERDLLAELEAAGD